MTEEVRFFRRVAIYASVVAAIYWFVSYEPAGTVLLLFFGIATGASTLLLWWGARGRARRDAGVSAGRAEGRAGAGSPAGGDAGATGAETRADLARASAGGAQCRADLARASAGGAQGRADLAPDGPFGDESGRIPAPTLSPFLVGLSVALIALGLVFGAWFVLAALIPLGLGAGAWLAAVRGELAGVEDDEARPVEDAVAASDLP